MDRVIADTVGAYHVRIGRISDISTTGGRVRSWLQAAVRRFVIYVGYRSSSGRSDTEIPLFDVQRTHADEPWMAA